MKKSLNLFIAWTAMSLSVSAQNLKTVVNDAPVEMIEVKGGTFVMGDHNKQNVDALPLHDVTLSSYYIGRTEVTQKLWTAVMGYNNSHFKGDFRPVENIGYDEIMQFISKLNAMTGVTFRLPTEAEWEYAARGGAMSKGYVYSGSNVLDEVAWTGVTNMKPTTHNVANKAPNELGIYDMTGNVWEWCSDYNGAYTTEAQKNPKGPKKETWHQVRGGGFSHFAYWSQVCYRDQKYPSGKGNDVGFRLAMDVSKKNTKRMELADEWLLTKDVVAEKKVTEKNEIIRPKGIEEKDTVANPTKEMLVGVWQECITGAGGARRYVVEFKILEADGTFMNLGVKNMENALFGIGANGTWTLEDGCLVETIATDSPNIFRGKANAMELTLSDNGNLMHIIWVNPVTGARTDEYYEKVR